MRRPRLLWKSSWVVDPKCRTGYLPVPYRRHFSGPIRDPIAVAGGYSMRVSYDGDIRPPFGNRITEQLLSCVTVVLVQLRNLHYDLLTSTFLKTGHLGPPVGCLLNIHEFPGTNRDCALWPSAPHSQRSLILSGPLQSHDLCPGSRHMKQTSGGS